MTTELRRAAEMALTALELDAYGEPPRHERNAAIDALRAALATQSTPDWWRSGLASTLMREGINKHRAREIAEGYWSAYCELEGGSDE